MVVKDDEVQTKRSPFAMMENEKKINDGYDGYTSMQLVLNRIDKGIINEEDLYILMYLNEYEFMTSRQINKLLEDEGKEYTEYKKLNRKLEKMLKNKLVNRTYFGSFGTKAAYKVYSLDKNGKYILEAKDIKVDWVPTDNLKNVGEIKAKLAANQVMIAIKEKSKNYIRSKGNVRIDSKNLNKHLETKGYLELKYQDAVAQIILESVRREEGWKERLLDRLKIYEDFYTSFEAGDSNFQMPPYLLFVAEDKKHMAEIYEVIVLNGIKLNNKYFTYDLIQMDSEINKSWFTFEDKENVINLVQLDIELLK